MTLRHRVYVAQLLCFGLWVGAGLLLQHRYPDTMGWLFAWFGIFLLMKVVVDRVARCPYCNARQLGWDQRGGFDRFAFIRCQSCRRRFDGREGPDPEISDEALAGRNPRLLAAYRDTSAEMRLSFEALKDPAARRARLAQLETEIRGCENELQRLRSGDGRENDHILTGFARQSLEAAQREIVELRQLDARATPSSSRPARGA